MWFWCVLLCRSWADAVICGNRKLTITLLRPLSLIFSRARYPPASPLGAPIPACKSGYTWKDKKCQAIASRKSSSGGVVLAATGHMVDAKLAENGITGFKAQSNGWNTNGIASWFRVSIRGGVCCYLP